MLKVFLPQAEEYRLCQHFEYDKCNCFEGLIIATKIEIANWDQNFRFLSWNVWNTQ